MIFTENFKTADSTTLNNFPLKILTCGNVDNLTMQILNNGF